MRTVKTGVVLVIAVVLTLGVGVIAGMIIARLPSAQANEGRNLQGELKLSDKQREEMRAIWEGVQKTVQNCFDEARGIQRQREDELLKLLTDEQKIKAEKITAEHARRFDELVQQREKSFRDAVEQTRKILDPAQRQAYDRMIDGRMGKAWQHSRRPEDLFAPFSPGAGTQPGSGGLESMHEVPGK